jgi:hypothetical protein
MGERRERTTAGDLNTTSKTSLPQPSVLSPKEARLYSGGGAKRISDDEGLSSVKKLRIIVSSIV